MKLLPTTLLISKRGTIDTVEQWLEGMRLIEFVEYSNGKASQQELLAQLEKRITQGQLTIYKE